MERKSHSPLGNQLTLKELAEGITRLIETGGDLTGEELVTDVVLVEHDTLVYSANTICFRVAKVPDNANDPDIYEVVSFEPRRLTSNLN